MLKSTIKQFVFFSTQIGCLTLSLAACGGHTEKQNASYLPAQTLIRVLDDEISSLDPQKISTVTDNRVATDLFEGLTTYGASGQVNPGIAESWETSASGLQWTFRLHPLATFSDGTLITDKDVVFSLQRAVTAQTAAPMAKLLYVIRGAEAIVKGNAKVSTLGVTAVGKNLIRIDLVRPAPELLEILSQPVAAIIPRSRVMAQGDNWSKAEGLVTSGPFKITRHVLHSFIELTRNPAYHDARHVKLQKVLYYPISDRDTAIRKFRAKEVDILTDFPLTKYNLLKKEVPEAIHIEDYRGSYYYVFNTRKPPFDNAAVRHALNLAVDRNIIAQKVVGLGHKPAYSVVPPGMNGYGDPVRPAWSLLAMNERMETAKALMKKSGYSEKNPLIFDISFNSSDDHKRVALAVSQMWKLLGVQATLSNTEAAVHFASLRKGDFTVARSGWIADYATADNFLSVYKQSAGVMNYSGYHDQRFDADYDNALQIADNSKRNVKLREAENRILDADVVVPLYYYRTRNLVAKTVVGWFDNNANINPSRYLDVDR